MTYTVHIQNSDASLVYDIPYDSFNISEGLNKDRQATINFNYETINTIAGVYGVTVEFILSASYREVYIKNEDDDTVYSGYISELAFLGGESGGSVRVSSKGFLNLFNKRFTDVRSYSSTDLSDIAWGLINYSQGLSYGDFGITRGADPTTRNADRTYQYKNIKQAIERLSNNNIINGIDFDIDNDKAFNVYYPQKGSKRNNIILQENFNIESFEVIKTFMDAMTNQAIVIGEGFNSDDMLVETRDASATYKSNFFLLQETLSEKDINVTQTLQDKGDKYLELFRAPRKIISVQTTDTEPTYTNYNLGDELKVEIPSIGVNNFYRLHSRTLDDNNRVKLELQEL